MSLSSALSNKLKLKQKNKITYVEKYYTPWSQIFLNLENLEKITKKTLSITAPKSCVLHKNKNCFNIPYFHSQYMPNTVSLKHVSKESRPIFIAELTNTLNILHTIKINTISYFDLKRKITLFWNLLGIDDREIKKLYKKGLEIAIAIKNSPLPVCLCHNDLTNGNILWVNKQILLIDFDFSALNFRLFDICSFLTENHLSDDEKSFFIKQMKLSKLEYYWLKNIIDFQDILWGFWALYYFFQTKKQIYITIATEKLARFFSSSFWKHFISNYNC